MTWHLTATTCLPDNPSYNAKCTMTWHPPPLPDLDESPTTRHPPRLAHLLVSSPHGTPPNSPPPTCLTPHSWHRCLPPAHQPTSYPPARHPTSWHPPFSPSLLPSFPPTLFLDVDLVMYYRLINNIKFLLPIIYCKFCKTNQYLTRIVITCPKTLQRALQHLVKYPECSAQTIN